MKSPLTTLCYVEHDGCYLMMHRICKEKDENQDKWIGIGGHFEEGESPEECLLREAKEETGLTLRSFRFRGLVTFVSDLWGTEYMCLYTAKLPEEDTGFLSRLRGIPQGASDQKADGNAGNREAEKCVPEAKRPQEKCQREEEPKTESFGESERKTDSREREESEKLVTDEGVLEWVPKQEIEKLNLWEGDKIFLRLLAENAPFFSLKLRYEGDMLKEAVLDGKPIVRC